MKNVLIFCFFCLMVNCTSDDKEDLFCTTEVRDGLRITVKDGVTNQILGNIITVVATDGTYEETLFFLEDIEQFVGAAERTGNYTIEITSPNHQDFTFGTIAVSADECHVITEELEFVLQPN
jgi:hypothetical protein